VSHLVLASGSAVRARLLEAAGVSFDVRPAQVDEEAVKQRFRASGRPAADLAAQLAADKALAGEHRGAFVLGADQVLTCDGAWYDKPADMAAARRQLLALRGHAHDLTGGLALAYNGAIVWRHTAKATLTMRNFSDRFLDDYLARAGVPILGSVGAYHFEGLGAQLFERIEGDYFTILGLPLLPLLAALRERGVIEA
jgi:septum formation protein